MVQPHIELRDHGCATIPDTSHILVNQRRDCVSFNSIDIEQSSLSPTLLRRLPRRYCCERLSMAGRNRGRANPNQDADEERRLWKEIRERAKEVDAMVVSIAMIYH